MKHDERIRMEDEGPEVFNSILPDEDKNEFASGLRKISKSKISCTLVNGYYLFVIEGIPYGHLVRVKREVKELMDETLTDRQKKIIGVEIKVNEGKKFIKHI